MNYTTDQMPQKTVRVISIFHSFITALLLILLTANVYGQQQNNWYFGKYAGMNFGGGSPVATSNPAMNRLEGDASGNLLFYSDGETIWNSSNVAMPNGTGIAGNQTSVQAVLIVPMPGSTTIFYVFTPD